MYTAFKDAAVQARADGEMPADVAQTFIQSGQCDDLWISSSSVE